MSHDIVGRHRVTIGTHGTRHITSAHVHLHACNAGADIQVSLPIQLRVEGEVAVASPCGLSHKCAHGWSTQLDCQREFDEFN